MYNTKKTHIHFIGIGGIGMSGIATILKHQGYSISGCDLDHDQPNVKKLKDIGCNVYLGNNTTSCNDESIGVLVYSSAIKKDNPEIIRAQHRGIPTISRALMLAEIMRTKYSIAISGSHGKTTTTSLISHILMVAQIDPTVIIGGNLINLSTNARIGNGDFVVVEADESDRSFLHLDATIAIVTNIDLEHLETYNDITDIKQAFLQFLENIPFYGKAIVCNDNEHVRSIIPITHVKTITYGITYPSDFYATDVSLHKDHTVCSIWYHTTKLGTLHIPMPGTHNVLNALAAITVAYDLEIPFDVISHALATFKGIERRFSLCGIYKGAEIFDDYGHHPQEILQTLNVAYNRTKGKIVVVFQPHRYSRTHKLWNQFVDIFSNAAIDHLIITDIYAASEPAIEHVHSRQLVADIKAKNPAMNTQYIPYSDSLMELKTVVDALITSDTLVLLQGAGKINRLAKSLL